MQIIFLNAILPIFCGIASNIISNKVIYNYSTLKVEKNRNVFVSKGAQATQLIVPIFVIISIFMSEFRWVLNNLEKFILIFSTFLISVFLLILFLWSYKRKWYPQVVQMIIIVTFFITLYLVDLAMPKYIKYECPLLVNNEEIIKGSVSDFMNKYYIYPIVTAPQGVGWIQEVTQPAQDNLWTSHVRFEGSPGEQYKLSIYASKEDINLISGRPVSLEDIKKLAKFGAKKGISYDVKIK